MNPEQWARIKDVFTEALDQPPEERAAFIRENAMGDETVRAEVERMLRAHDTPGGLKTDAGLAGLGAVFADASTREDLPAGTVVGPYVISRLIGEGGMGSVYLAEQSAPIRRQVAIKFISVAISSKEVISRFSLERDAMSKMDSTHIASALDAGVSADGRPYVVMEYIDGLAIDAYCERHTLSVRDRLALFEQVCRGIQHAHQKGIVHRDIKPSNVLVTEEDGVPVVKIIDFGIAKVINKTEAERTVFTQVGELIGTPEYMSPEQARPGKEGVDTRTDIYSLGVLLYQLVTGEHPFDLEELRRAAYDEIRRMICEVTPAKPSSRLHAPQRRSAPDSAKTLEQSTSLRAKDVRGDLDWIIMKAIEKEPARRYPSVSDLTADIERHLHNEPVLAGPPSRVYRAGKFYRRHRAGVLATGLVALALIGGSIGTTYGMLEASRRSALSLNLNEMMREILLTYDPESKTYSTIPVKYSDAEHLDDIFGVDRFGTELRSSFQVTFGILLRNLSEFDKAESALLSAIEALEYLYGDSSEITVAAKNELGVLHYLRGSYAEASGLFVWILEHATDSESVTDAFDLANSNLRTMAFSAEALEDARRYGLMRTAALSVALGPTDSKTLSARHNHASVLYKLGRCEIHSGNPALGNQLLEEALENHLAVLGVREEFREREFSRSLISSSAVAGTLAELGRYQEAEPYSRHAVEQENLSDTVSQARRSSFLRYHGMVLVGLGRYEEAEDTLLQAKRHLDELNMGALSATAADITLRNSPRYFDVLLALQRLYSATGRAEKADEFAVVIEHYGLKVCN